MTKYEFGEGVLWDDNPWIIETDRKCTGTSACRHSIATKDGFIQPAVVIVHNEGGFNSTGLCLNCIIEAAEGLGKDGFLM